MKKVVLVLVLGIVFLTVGCAKEEKIKCTVEGKEAIFTLKNGIITNYKLDGKDQSAATVDEINGTYFTSSDDNEEGKATLKSYVSKIGGNCSYE